VTLNDLTVSALPTASNTVPQSPNPIASSPLPPIDGELLAQRFCQTVLVELSPPGLINHNLQRSRPQAPKKTHRSVYLCSMFLLTLDQTLVSVQRR